MKLASGHPVIHCGRIDSTNSEARRLADGGECGPLWLTADEQTAGRGRMGRNWVSKPGNLYATFLFSIAAGPEVAAQVSFVAALAVHDMVTALLPSLSPRIKWPNDVLIDGAKFCGVLPEVVGVSPTRIAIGCGVNVAHAPQGTPYPVTCLADHALNMPATPEELETKLPLATVLHHLDEGLSNRLRLWDEGRGFGRIREAWEARALGLGGEVRTGTLRGMFVGLAPDGALILKDADGLHHVHSGEVTFAELARLRES